MKKTLVTTAAVLALAGAAAAPASAADCFRGAEQVSPSSFSAAAQPERQEAQAQNISFQSVAAPQVNSQDVGQAAEPSAQVTTAPATDSATTDGGTQVTTQSTTTTTSDAATSSFSDQVAQEMLGMMNQARAEAGLAPLSTNADLTAIAAGWSQQMAASNSASHSPTFIEQTQATGSTNMAENVAYDVTSGKSVQETAQYFYNFWMNSPGHYANIMNPDLNAIGFSLAESSNGYVYATQNFGSY
ncbi:CAP domain-containing protein [Kocuria sp.]|uniref:CAP domain-containing protein n=1 Tax=Kocuria sp. TaxID=1871328 RepID=UPI0026DFB36D|nr:CAP domain-containing protein [Kocuria sp.]MDO5617231.1 CAP domain-containing protein [Kocuria sp.]